MRSRFHWKIGVGDLLSPRFNYLPFLQNVRLQLSTPGPWGIVRSCRGGFVKIQIETIILTDVMISATATYLLVPAGCNPASLWIEHLGAYIGAYSQVRSAVTWLWRVYLGACVGVFCERLSESTVKQTGSVIQCKWECTWEHAQKCAWEWLEALEGTMNCIWQFGWMQHDV